MNKIEKVIQMATQTSEEVFSAGQEHANSSKPQFFLLLDSRALQRPLAGLLYFFLSNHDEDENYIYD